MVASAPSLGLFAVGVRVVQWSMAEPLVIQSLKEKRAEKKAKQADKHEGHSTIPHR